MIPQKGKACLKTEKDLRENPGTTRKKRRNHEVDTGESAL